MIQNKAVFFEEIDLNHQKDIERYLSNGFDVYYFVCDKRYRNSNGFKNLSNDQRLRDINKIVFEYRLYREAAFLSHENVDAFYDTYISKSRSIPNLIRLIGDDKLVEMYKKQVLSFLAQNYETHLKINEIISTEKLESVEFIPKYNAQFHRNRFSILSGNIKIIDNKGFSKLIRELSDKTKESVLLGYPLWLLFKKIKGFSRNKIRKDFKTGICVEKHTKSIFLMNYLTESFYVDENELPKEEVLFIDENKELNVNEYQKRGFNYTRLMDDREVVTYDLLWNVVIRSFIPTLIRSMIYSITEDSIITITNRKILSDYILWNIFCDSYKIDNYAKRMLPDHISRTLLLSQNNVKTWIIYPDNTSIDYHIDWEHSKKNQTTFSFMHYDNAIIYGEAVKQFLQKHRNQIGRYIKNGVLYSEVVQQLTSRELITPLPDLIKKKNLPGTIVTVFDTTFVDFGPVKIKDGIKFGNDILKLLDDFPNIGIIFKAMKEPALTPYLTGIYDKLSSHERCILFYRYDQEGISSPEVIAYSDFVISAAYTSPSAEALGAKKKAIYYDVAGHDISDKYYYNNYPNFVAHNYEELKKLTNYWLYECDEADFDAFLETYVRDEIDPYLDGKALTRMRKYLRGEENVG